MVVEWNPAVRQYETLFASPSIARRAARRAAAATAAATATARPGACPDCAWVEVDTRLSRRACAAARPRSTPTASSGTSTTTNYAVSPHTELMGDLPCGKGRWLMRAELGALERDRAALQNFYGFLEERRGRQQGAPRLGPLPGAAARAQLERKPVHGAETLVWDN